MINSTSVALNVTFAILWYKPNLCLYVQTSIFCGFCSIFLKLSSLRHALSVLHAFCYIPGTVGSFDGISTFIQGPDSLDSHAGATRHKRRNDSSGIKNNSYSVNYCRTSVSLLDIRYETTYTVNQACNIKKRFNDIPVRIRQVDGVPGAISVGGNPWVLLGIRVYGRKRPVSKEESSAAVIDSSVKDRREQFLARPKVAIFPVIYAVFPEDSSIWKVIRLP